MRSRPDVARAEPHPGRQTGHLESERLEDGGEERILFKAIPASAAGDQLCLQRVQVERDRPLEQYIEILKRDTGRVSQVKSAQGLECRREKAPNNRSAPDTRPSRCERRRPHDRGRRPSKCPYALEQRSIRLNDFV